MKQFFTHMIDQSISIILDRFERNASGYGFIDTKFDIVTGRDFERPEPYFQNDFIFGIWKESGLFPSNGGWSELRSVTGTRM